MDDTHAEKDHLPIIDLSQATTETGDQLVEAASKWGFLYIRNRGLGFDTEIIDRIFELSRQFFKSPIEEKKAVAITSDDRGWSSPYAEVLDPENQQQGDFKEAFNFGDFLAYKAQQPLPKSLAAHEAELNDFVDRCRKLCAKILELFAIGLKIDETKGGKSWFTSRHDPSKGPSGTVLRLNYYPYSGVETSGSLEAGDGIIRGAAHTDFGAMTLLFQRASQPGLEIQKPDSSWSPVAVFPPGTESGALPPIVVNIGDLLKYWTKGLLKSTVHRVNIPKVGKEDRYSIAFFCHPVASTELIPIPSKMVSEMSDPLDGEDQGGITKKAITAKEHLHNRLAAVYGWGHENGVEVA